MKVKKREKKGGGKKRKGKTIPVTAHGGQYSCETSIMHEFEKGYQPRTKIGTGIASPRYWVYIGSVMLGRQKYVAEP
jgi:hypothetical protein